MNNQITAQNYAAQAAKSLSSNIGEFADKDYIKSLVTSLRSAQHFVLPDGGTIFDDKCKGLIGEEIYLPFPSITIEYFVKDTNLATLENSKIEVRKRLSIVMDTDRLGKNGTKTPSILILPLACVNNRWVPYAFSIVIEKTWDRIKSTEVNTFAVTGRTELVMEELINKMEKEGKISKDQIKGLEEDALNEVVPVLELLEALTCKNIKPTVFQEASKANPKRERQGKAPIWETKILMVDTTSTKERISVGTKIEGRKSPSEHLRRGHPRRLANGTKIWINNTIVGNPDNGKTNKDYRIR